MQKKFLNNPLPEFFLIKFGKIKLYLKNACIRTAIRFLLSAKSEIRILQLRPD